MTLSEILTLCDSLYPNAVSNTDKILFMNIAQGSLSEYFGKIVEDATLLTVIDQDSYTFPTGIKDVTDIESLAIGTQATPDNRYDYTQYYFNKSEQNPESEYGYYQIVNSSGTKKLVIYPAPSTVNLPIHIRYRKQLTDLSTSALNTEPEFDARFHPILAYWACRMICMTGASPDTYQANMFMQMYDELLGDLWKVSMADNTKRQVKRKDNRQWHKHGSYGAGY